MHVDIVGLLKYIEDSKLFKGSGADMDVKSVAVDSTEKADPTIPSSIGRHSNPKSINPEESDFQVTILYRSVGCDTLIGIEHSSSSCKPCESALKRLKRVINRKDRGLDSPAKSKTPLSNCRPKKLQSTVVSSRLQIDLEERLQEMQNKIQQHGVGFSNTLEKDILTIMGCQNLHAPPHMTFFDICLRGTTTIHLHTGNYETVVPFLVRDFFGTTKIISSQKLGLIRRKSKVYVKKPYLLLQ